MTATATRAKTKKASPEQKICNEIIALLEKGVSPFQKPWTAQTSGTYRNLITSHMYSGANTALLIMYEISRGYTSNLYVGYSQAAKKNWTVKKGSKACYILHPVPVKFDKKDKEGNQVKDDKGNVVKVQFMNFKPVAVFNSDCLIGADEKAQDSLEQAIKHEERNIKENFTDVETRKHKAFTALKAYMDKEEIPLKEGGDKAYYSPSRDFIGMPNPKQFQNVDGYLATLSHECIHSTKKESRLDRSFGFSMFGNEAYGKEELVAEMGSAILTRKLNVGSKIENHASYLESWLRGIKEDPSYLFKSLAFANKAVNFILDNDSK